MAGRIAITELGSLNVREIAGSASATNNKFIEKLWLRGGFPKSYLAKFDRASLDWRADFIRTYLERDIPQLGPRIPAETLRRFWIMVAHSQGSTLNASKFATSLEVSERTIGRYLDLLVDLLLVRRLQPCTANVKKRLVKSPKVYVRDSGIAHALLGVDTADRLLGNPVVGGSWEGFVIENIMSAAPRHSEAYFYRTSGGAEIDLLLELPAGRRIAVEIKRTLAPKLVKGFTVACDDLDISERYIVYAGTENYPLRSTTKAVSVTSFMDILAHA